MLRPGSVGMRGYWSYDHGKRDHKYTPLPREALLYFQRYRRDVMRVPKFLHSKGPRMTSDVARELSANHGSRGSCLGYSENCGPLYLLSVHTQMLMHVCIHIVVTFCEARELFQDEIWRHRSVCARPCHGSGSLARHSLCLCLERDDAKYHAHRWTSI